MFVRDPIRVSTGQVTPVVLSLRSAVLSRVDYKDRRLRLLHAASGASFVVISQDGARNLLYPINMESAIEVPSAIFIVSLFSLIRCAQVYVRVASLAVPVRYQSGQVQDDLIYNAVHLTCRFSPLSTVGRFGLANDLLCACVTIVVSLRLALFPLLYYCRGGAVHAAQPVSDHNEDVFRRFSQFGVK